MSELDGLLVVPHPIEGWRFFTVSQNRLHSIFRGMEESYFAYGDTEWHDAICHPYKDIHPVWAGTYGLPRPSSPHEVPAMGCECGFHAWKTRDLAFESLTPYYSSRVFPRVFARVELAGPIILHEKGYRARSLRICEWWLFSDYVLEEYQKLGEQPEGDPGEVSPFEYFVRYFGTIAKTAHRCRHCGIPLCTDHSSYEFTCVQCGNSTGRKGCWLEPRL